VEALQEEVPAAMVAVVAEVAVVAVAVAVAVVDMAAALTVAADAAADWLGAPQRPPRVAA
jgi:hypothetical protein